MKGLFYLFLCLCVCISLVSCEDEEDNAIKLTVNTSAYDVVKGLKSVDGNLLFTGELTDGLQLRFTYLVLKQGEEEVSIVAKDTRYVSNVKDVASYTTGELEPGEYRVVVVSDFVRGDKEFNWLAFDTQTKGFSVLGLRYRLANARTKFQKQEYNTVYPLRSSSIRVGFPMLSLKHPTPLPNHRK